MKVKVDQADENRQSQHVVLLYTGLFLPDVIFALLHLRRFCYV